MIQKELNFSRYPHKPGWKGRDTSRYAALDMQVQAPTLRQSCLDLLISGAELTADEIAEALDKTILAIRPRVTELSRQGLIEDTGTRRKNVSGKMAIVWRVA